MADDHGLGEPDEGEFDEYDESYGTLAPLYRNPDDLDTLAYHSNDYGEFCIGLGKGTDGQMYLCEYITDMGYTDMKEIVLESDAGRAMIAAIAGSQGWDTPLDYDERVRRAAEDAGRTPWEERYIVGAIDRLPRDNWPTGLDEPTMMHLSEGGTPVSRRDRDLAWELAYDYAIEFQTQQSMANREFMEAIWPEYGGRPC